MLPKFCIQVYPHAGIFLSRAGLEKAALNCARIYKLEFHGLRDILWLWFNQFLCLYIYRLINVFRFDFW